jgi:hypothetical protein
MDETQILLGYVKQNLGDQLATKKLGGEYFYYSLPLAAIDAVFSAQAKYPTVQNVIQRYCSKYGLITFRPQTNNPPPKESQESVSDVIQKIRQAGIPYFVEQVFVNRSKTSGRLKVEVMLEVLETLEKLQIQYLQDIQVWLTQPKLQQNIIDAITSIHGIGEATYRYFLMLVGDDQMVKPDTMILRFINNALGRVVNAAEAVSLVQGCSHELLSQYPNLNPRLLDYLIWSWQRDQQFIPKKSPSLHDDEGKPEIHRHVPKKNSDIFQSLRKTTMTIPEKTQCSMHRRYQAGQLLSSAQIKDDVWTDYRTPRSSVMPKDYCCNVWNKDPRSGVYHVFYFENEINKYRLLLELDINVLRQRGDCPRQE